MTFYQAHPFLKLLLVIALVATFLFFTAKSNCVYADQSDDLLQVVVTLMTSYGFENVRASILSDTLYIEYENRVYLREKDAISVIIPKLMNTVSGIQTFRLIPKKDNVPLFLITISRDDYQASIANKQNILDTLKISTTIVSPISAKKLYNPSSGKADIILHPIASIILGRYTDPFIPQYAISPEIVAPCEEV